MTGSGVLLLGRIRGYCAGLGYATILGGALALSWAIQSHVNELPTTAGWESFMRMGRSAVVYGGGIIPLVPFLVVAGNAAGLGRAGRLLLQTLLVVATAWWATYFVTPDLAHPAFAYKFAERLLALSLIAAACAYHRTARGAANTLLNDRIAGLHLTAELHRAELQLIRAQSEPHFLLNTLANVRSLARQDAAAAAEMLGNLSRYFSAGYSQLREDASSVAREMAITEAYLGIYQIRMGRRMTYEVCFPAEIAAIRLPTMMLLTLVENAIKHGVAPAVGGAHIRVSGERMADRLVLKVSDSGVGILPEHAFGTGTGLSNVRLRLAMRYGVDATLSLAHAEPRGVVATIRLPVGEPS